MGYYKTQLSLKDIVEERLNTLIIDTGSYPENTFERFFERVFNAKTGQDITEIIEKEVMDELYHPLTGRKIDLHKQICLFSRDQGRKLGYEPLFIDEGYYLKVNDRFIIYNGRIYTPVVCYYDTKTNIEKTCYNLTDLIEIDDGWGENQLYCEIRNTNHLKYLNGGAICSDTNFFYPLFSRNDLLANYQVAKKTCMIYSRKLKIEKLKNKVKIKKQKKIKRYENEKLVEHK